MKQWIAFILCCLMLTGCTTAPAETTAPVPPVAATQPSAAETAPPETTGIQEHFITLYAPNEDATGFIYTSWEVSEISAETICGALIEAGVLNGDVAFHRLLLENGQLTLDVNNAFQRQLMSYGTAGEYMMVGSVVNTLLSIYSAETVMITVEGEIMESGHVVYDLPLEFFGDEAEEVAAAEDGPWDMTPMVMVDGRIYVTTGRESTVTARCGVMDGTIHSQVEGWQAPSEDDQSNFGTGYGYQYGSEPGTIELNIDGKWWVYTALGEYSECIALIEFAETEVLLFDDVEMLDVPSQRAEELGITPENYSGVFFLHNETAQSEELPVSPDCVCMIFDWENGYTQKSVGYSEFADIFAQRNASTIPYHLTIENSEIIQIEEIYVP